MFRGRLAVVWLMKGIMTWIPLDQHALAQVFPEVERVCIKVARVTSNVAQVGLKVAQV